jgi:hypothetical protein
MSRAILFNHPGREHVPPRGQSFFPWNTDKHRRKFLITPARLARGAGAGWTADKEWREVGLWGEWEPPSECDRFSATGHPLFPVAWHRPLLGGPRPPGAQNTDPWVFGPTMRYSNCRQERNVELRSLRHGDVIFFGSVKHMNEDGSNSKTWNFFLDTVFVVGSSQPYDPYLPAQLPVDRVFREHVLACLGGDGCRGYTLYEGVMLGSDDTSDIFSYVPCKLTAGDYASARFARPRIDHLFGPRFNIPMQPLVWLPDDPIEAWEKVTKTCLSAGLELAVEVETPSKAASIPPGSLSPKPARRKGC